MPSRIYLATRDAGRHGLLGLCAVLLAGCASFQPKTPVATDGKTRGSESAVKRTAYRGEDARVRKIAATLPDDESIARARQPLPAPQPVKAAAVIAPASEPARLAAKPPATPSPAIETPAVAAATVPVPQPGPASGAKPAAPPVLAAPKAAPLVESAKTAPKDKVETPAPKTVVAPPPQSALPAVTRPAPLQAETTAPKAAPQPDPAKAAPKEKAETPAAATAVTPRTAEAAPASPPPAKTPAAGTKPDPYPPVPAIPATICGEGTECASEPDLRALVTDKTLGWMRTKPTVADLQKALRLRAVRILRPHLDCGRLSLALEEALWASDTLSRPGHSMGASDLKRISALNTEVWLGLETEIRKRCQTSPVR